MIRDWPTSGVKSILSGPLGLDSEGSGEAGQPVLVMPPLSRFESSNSVTARQAGFAGPASGAPRSGGGGDMVQLSADYSVPMHSPSLSSNGFSSHSSHVADEDEDETFGPERRSIISLSVEKEAKRAAEARSRLRRQIDPLPRVGALLTLDVKSNEIGRGVGYIAQVLKRNRTLKVLNLSENRIDVQGLVVLADALRYNTTLETLDLSRNPCSGPSVDGIIALRTACTINTSLKRIFLNATNLSSEGAIALAEFLPEVKNLIHLDLTENHEIDIAGVMALAVSVKMNTSLRCLDLNIPPNDPDFARLSQDILQSCARNTEMAQAEAIARGATAPISAPHLKSAVARELNTRQEQETVKQERQAQREESWKPLVAAAEETHEVLFEIVTEDEGKKTPDGRVVCSDVARELLDQAKANQLQLLETMKGMKIGELKDRATTINEQLAALVMRADVLYSGKTTPRKGTSDAGLLSPRQSTDEPGSPSFSITDGESSDEEGQVASTSARPIQGLRLAMPTNREVELNSASPRSPVDAQSRGMTLEEGEVFRRGNALGAEMLEAEETSNVPGDELKETILEAELPRSPQTRSPRSSVSESSPPTSPRSSDNDPVDE